MENDIRQGSLKEIWIGIKKLLNDKYEQKLEKVYEDWQKPVYYKPPFWFMLLTLIAFNDSAFASLTELERIAILKTKSDYSLTKLQRFVRNRTLAMDYTLPLPKWLYDKVYDEHKRLPNSFLIIFYNQLLGTLKAKGSDTKAVEKFIVSPYVTPFVKKIIKQWLDDMASGTRSFRDCLMDSTEMFGKFETNVYSEGNKLGISVTILERIVSNLKDLVQLDKAIKKVKKECWGYAIMFIGLIYAVFGYTVPQLFDAMELESLPADMQAMYDFGVFLMTPLGVCCTGLFVIFNVFAIKKISKNELLSGYITKIPKLGDFIRFIELYLFTDTVQLFYAYMQGTDDYKIRRAITVVSNSFLRGFLNYRLDTIAENAERTENFFKDNKFFGEYSEYLTVKGLMKNKLSELRDVLRFNKDDVLKSFPEVMRFMSTLVSLIIFTILTLFIARIELFAVSPSNIVV